MFFYLHSIFLFIVVYRTTRLTKREIRRISTFVGADWDRMAGLMNIPYSEREEIKMNHAKYPDSFSKAAKIFSLFNDREDFCRGALKKCVEELNLRDAKSEIRPVGKVFRHLSFTKIMFPPQNRRLYYYVTQKYSDEIRATNEIRPSHNSPAVIDHKTL